MATTAQKNFLKSLVKQLERKAVTANHPKTIETKQLLADQDFEENYGDERASETIEQLLEIKERGKKL